MNRLTWKRGLDGITDTGLRDGVTVVDVVCRLADIEEILGGGEYDLDRLREAVRGEENEPLTLDELREMGGEPVWVCSINGLCGVWMLAYSDHCENRTGVAGYDDFDKIWQAYRREPEGRITLTDDGCWTKEVYYRKDVDNAPTVTPESPQQWISVKDALPDAFAPVIVCRSGGKVEAGSRGLNGWWNVYGTRTKTVTHWMPLPDPPEEEPT